MVKCPRCNSKHLYRFGKDPKTTKQKYRCCKCSRQFKIGDGYGKERIKYRMPECQNAQNAWRFTNGENTLRDCVVKDVIISSTSIAFLKKS